MGYVELIGQLQALPQDKQAEVFDLVEFLSHRDVLSKKSPHTHTDWAESEFASMAIGQTSLCFCWRT